MSIYTTTTIKKDKAISLLRELREAKRDKLSPSEMTVDELDEEIHSYLHAENERYNKVFSEHGYFLNNFIIEE